MSSNGIARWYSSSTGGHRPGARRRSDKDRSAADMRRTEFQAAMLLAVALVGIGLAFMLLYST